MNKNLNMLIVPVVFAGLLVAGKADVLANDDCDSTYGGETCEEDLGFSKEVRFVDEDDEDSEDKITKVKEDDTVVFVIRVTNEGETTFEDLEVKDSLPDALYRVGGDELKETRHDLKPGEEWFIRIQAKIKSEEFDKENFEKCVVNKAELYIDGDKERKDTATVCYGKGEITELPKTGADAGILSTIAGLGFVTLGTITSLIKRKSA